MPLGGGAMQRRAAVRVGCTDKRAAVPQQHSRHFGVAEFRRVVQRRKVARTAGVHGAHIDVARELLGGRCAAAHADVASASAITSDDRPRLHGRFLMLPVVVVLLRVLVVQLVVVMPPPPLVAADLLQPVELQHGALDAGAVANAGSREERHWHSGCIAGRNQRRTDLRDSGPPVRGRHPGGCHRVELARPRETTKVSNG